MPDERVKAFMDSCPRAVAVGGSESAVLVFQWSRPGVGFGELVLLARDGKLVAATEHMGVDFCLDVLRQALEEGVVR